MSRRLRIRTKRSVLRRALRAAILTTTAGAAIGTFLVMRGLPRPLGPRVREPTVTDAPPVAPSPTATVSTPRPKREVTIFVLDGSSGLLVPVRREVDQEPALAPQARRAVEALVAPGADPDSPRLFPDGTKVLALFVDARGEAFVDLSAEATQPTGIEEELLALASLALTLSRNFPEIERLHLLVEGRETTTLRGHLSVEYPLLARDPIFEGLVQGAAGEPETPLPAPATEPAAEGPLAGEGSAAGAVDDGAAGPPTD